MATRRDYPALSALFYVSLLLASLGHLGVLSIQGMIMYGYDEDVFPMLFGIAGGIEVFFGLTAFIFHRLRHRNDDAANVYYPINNHHTVYSASD